MSRFLLLSSILIALLALPVSAGAATDADPALEQQAQIIFGEVLSPFCPGRLLRDCPSSAATELKDRIRGEVRAGKSREEILAGLYALYGDQIRAVPAVAGFGLAAWLAPGIFLLLGLLIIGMWLRSRRSMPEVERPAANLTPEMEERIRRELGR